MPHRHTREAVGGSTGTAAVDGASAWYYLISEDIPSASDLASESRSRSEEGGDQPAAVAASSANISRTSSYLPPALASTNSSQGASPPPDPTSTKADESALRNYDLPVRSRMAIPQDYKRDNDKKYTDKKSEGGSGFNHPPAPGFLAHISTLDPSVVGSTKHTLSGNVSHDLAEPTPLVPSPKGP